MALLQRLPKDHSIREFRRAAFSRIREAKYLALADHRLAAIYFSGYAVEMILKAAYFRVCGRGRNDPISLKEILDVKPNDAKSLSVTWPGNAHDLVSWANVLVARRKALKTPYKAAFARSLVSRVKRIARCWKEDLRYWSRRPYRGEVQVTFQATEWLIGQERFL